VLTPRGGGERVRFLRDTLSVTSWSCALAFASHCLPLPHDTIAVTTVTYSTQRVLS